ncbi:MAG: hypothetical protein LBB60_10565 [Desulfovibrio sp.]|jgi:hypothetical protein|nr:hypothetical protein [Desulfovibrio sp.]
MDGKTEFVTRLNQQLAAMKTERQPFDEVWRLVATFESERMNMFQKPVSAARDSEYLSLHRDKRDIDNTSRQCITVFSSGMLSGVTPPSDQWFEMRIADGSGGDDLSKWGPVAKWLENVEKIILNDFTQKNFYTQQVNTYKNIGMYGMQCMLIGESKDIGTYYRDVPPDEIYVQNDFAGRVNCVFREMSVTYQQALELFGKRKLSKTVQKVVDNKEANIFDRMTIVHAVVKKAPGYENIVGNNRLAYASYYFEPSEGHLIDESGFDSMPYVVTRAYSDSRTPYSFSPGTVALADVLLVNEIKKLMLQAGQLSIAPPMLMPDRGIMGKLNYAPYAVNLFRKDGNTSADDFKPFQFGGNMKDGLDLLEMAKQDIKQAFFYDLFLMIHNRTQSGHGTPTAMEIEQLATEKSFLLAPILINQQQEEFNNLIARVFEIKRKTPGVLPPLPDELKGAGLDIKYISPLVHAQNNNKTQRMLKTLNDIFGVLSVSAQVDQAVASQTLDLINTEGTIYKLLEQGGFPQSCVRQLEEVQAMRQQRMQAQEAAMRQQQEQQAMQGLLQGYGQLSVAPETGSPVQQLMQNAGALSA